MIARNVVALVLALLLPIASLAQPAGSPSNITNRFVTPQGGATATIGNTVTAIAPYISVTPPITGPLHIELTYGQSNAGPSGNTGVVVGDVNAAISGPQFPANAFMFGRGNILSEPATYAPQGIASLQNWSESTLTQYLVMVPQTIDGFAYAQYLADQSVAARQNFYATVWYGGQPLETFIKGTQTYADLLTAALVSSKIIAGSTVDDLLFIQGESGSSGNYQTVEETLVANITADIQAQTGQATAPKFLFMQTNDSSGAVPGTPSTVAQAQLAVGQGTSGAILVGPEYYSPLNTTDNIHMTITGRCMQAAMVAIARKRVINDGLPWNPLWPTSITRVTNVITVHFALPPGGGNLAFDGTWVNATGVTNDGFSYTDSGGVITVSSVALGGDGTSVVVTLSADPSANTSKKILYAMGQSNTSGWSASRGLLISPTSPAVTNYCYTLGYTVPQFVNHYAVRFVGVVP